MEPEEQSTSLDLSKRLKELGVRQDSLFYWNWDGQNCFPTLRIFNLVYGKIPNSNLQDTNLMYSAFTSAELGEMLPNEISYNKVAHIYCREKTSEGWTNYYRQYENDKFIPACRWAIKEADAIAEIIIYLIENNLIDDEWRKKWLI